jgi:hypothetical protein
MIEIIYKEEKQDMVSHALSRNEEDTKGLFFFISMSQNYWVEEARI